MGAIIYALNFALLFSCLLDMRCRHAEQRLSFGLVRLCFFVPLLALESLYFSAHWQIHLVAPFLFSENIFALNWIVLAAYLGYVIDPPTEKTALYRMAPILTTLCGLAIGGLLVISQPAFKISDNFLTFQHFGYIFFSALFVLIAVLVNAWRLEAFWRALDQKARRQYKYLAIGFFLITGSLGWSASFRITYLRMKSDHLLLLAFLMIIAWLLIGYAIASGRLLNRRIFISRKIVYSTVAPFAFALYLIGLGLISLLIKTFGWSLPFVLQWLIIIAGLLLLTALTLSVRIRAKIQYFISTHFYVNKYEYRDEWLAFSDLLHRKLTENGVVEALRHILYKSMYTDAISIWIGDERKDGFRLVGAQGGEHEEPFASIPPDDPLVSYLQKNAYFDCRASASSPDQQRILLKKKDFFTSLGLVLMVPVAIGENFVGIIGLGPEYTGGTYGKDDFDLLSAISSQAASALIAVRTAEELAKAREQSAWNTLSAFVLHDIKNAATMLSLVQANAPQHIDNPEFQQDMMASIEDALKRMTKVQARLNTLKGDIEPAIRDFSARRLLQICCDATGKKLSRLKIRIECEQDFTLPTDPDFMAVIVENLFINALEANSGGDTSVSIKIEKTDNRQAQIAFTDNGPGIATQLLPDQLFEPFITSKVNGSGIGLWQVRQLVESLNGRISAQNAEEGGARFLLFIPATPS